MKKPEKYLLTFAGRLRRARAAGISEMTGLAVPEDALSSLQERIQQILGLAGNKKNLDMIYFIMYDIENNKVRTQISKFLIRKGCSRIQKSIFMAATTREVYREIYTTIKEVQDLYENSDSVFFVPISTDEVKAMKIVGQSVDFDLIMKNKNTLFF